MISDFMQSFVAEFNNYDILEILLEYNTLKGVSNCGTYFNYFDFVSAKFHCFGLPSFDSVLAFR